MTDRYFALSVLLEKDVRSDDAESIINAIKMVKGVSHVEPHVSNVDMWAAVERARAELGKRLLDVLYPDRNKLE